MSWASKASEQINELRVDLDELEAMVGLAAPPDDAEALDPLIGIRRRVDALKAFILDKYVARERNAASTVAHAALVGE